MKEQKELYIVINENNIITKIFYREIKFEKSKSIWTTRKENFDEDVDFDNAISVNPEKYANVKIGDIYIPETEENQQN